MKQILCLFFLFLSTLFITATQFTEARLLFTSSRWIVDESSQRVKLTCVNWVAHMEVMVVEGLTKQPLDNITKNILELGFNCVRLTWPIYLVTNESLADVTVRESFERNGLHDVIPALEAYNPNIVGLPLFKAFQEVVASLLKNQVMVILDNHVSKPGWCCTGSDGNAFFGDSDFDPSLWVTGLTRMAALFRGVPNVVGMSLRNELRGERENVDDWYKYMQMGAEAVHSANSDVLVILSGLNFDLDLSFLQNRPVNMSFVGKLVFERHWYAFSDNDAWKNGNPNEVCGRIGENLMRNTGFLLDQGFPLFVSEFGIDQRGGNVNDNRYIDCFLSKAAELDWDWALWSYVGSYYLKERQTEVVEHYGVMDSNWVNVQNPNYLKKLASIQLPFRGPRARDNSLLNPHKDIYHPRTGSCIISTGSNPNPLILGPCEAQAWDYTPKKSLLNKKNESCMRATGVGQPVKLDTTCNDSSSKWEMISDSKMHFSATLGDGTVICLDVEDTKTLTLVTNPCKCLSKDTTCDPASQWFKLVESTT